MLMPRFRIQMLMIAVLVIGTQLSAITSGSDLRFIALITMLPVALMFWAASRPREATWRFIKWGVVTGIAQHTIITVGLFCVTNASVAAVSSVAMLMMNIGAGTTVGIVTEVAMILLRPHQGPGRAPSLNHFGSN